MHRSSKRRRKQWREKRSPGPLELSRKERTLFVALPILMVICAVLWLHFVGEVRTRQTREAWLDSLAVRYGVTDTQRSRIRELELSYHGSGSIFNEPAHTPAELATHRQLISEQIPVDAVDRFLADQDGLESLSASH